MTDSLKLQYGKNFLFLLTNRVFAFEFSTGKNHAL
nr:MAG TPA: hypothetical protein [Caudoviricetes sp.]